MLNILLCIATCIVTGATLILLGLGLVWLTLEAFILGLKYPKVLKLAGFASVAWLIGWLILFS